MEIFTPQQFKWKLLTHPPDATLLPRKLGPSLGSKFFLAPQSLFFFILISLLAQGQTYTGPPPFQNFFFSLLRPSCMAWGIRDLSSLTRDRTHVSCSGSSASSPLDHQGSPQTDYFITLSSHRSLFKFSSGTDFQGALGTLILIFFFF